MTPAERDELNAAVARLDEWTVYIDPHGDQYWFRSGQNRCVPGPPDYLNDPHLWTPILERLLKAGWDVCWLEDEERFYVAPDNVESKLNGMGETLAEATLRLFVALEGKV